METEAEPYLFLKSFFEVPLQPISIEVIIAIIAMLLLLIASALISGSEVACFSLTPSNINEIKKSENKRYTWLRSLLADPENLLATILITNNFVNVSIIILSTIITQSVFDFSQAPTLGFIFQVVIVTFLILLFGEIIPKVYANKYALKFAGFMAWPLVILEKIFQPLSKFLIATTSIINRKFSQKKQNLSIDDLSEALELTTNAPAEEKEMLKGIVKFSNTDAKGIMKSRVDVVAVDEKTSFQQLTSVIIEKGFSRIPVYADTFDNIKGILYVKDLLPYLNEKDNFDWKPLVRPPYFVPETKKISDLLEEFQKKKIHMALVIDEYGGTSGLVTLEDILEEIVGEISDEFDEEDKTFSKIDEKNFIFEGKTLINDFYRIVGVPDDTFDQVKGESETLAGIILELTGKIPKKGALVYYKNFIFRIEEVDERRIVKIKLTITNKKR